jgi:tetratricopeptide (TPR) repeat protein
MRFVPRSDPAPVRNFVRVGRWLVVAALISFPSLSHANDRPPMTADKLLSAGQSLSERTHYLEALDLLDEAKDMLEQSGGNQTALYAEVLYGLAQTKIKARNLQGFPAYYVKTALQEIHAANKLREKLPDVLPQRMAEGYYLEGYIHKKFFMRKVVARSCFEKAKKVDPGFAPALRELSELQGEERK